MKIIGACPFEADDLAQAMYVYNTATVLYKLIYLLFANPTASWNFENFNSECWNERHNEPWKQIDFSKCFRLVQHPILWWSLERLGTISFTVTIVIDSKISSHRYWMQTLINRENGQQTSTESQSNASLLACSDYSFQNQTIVNTTEKISQQTSEIFQRIRWHRKLNFNTYSLLTPFYVVYCKPPWIFEGNWILLLNLGIFCPWNRRLLLVE